MLTAQGKKNLVYPCLVSVMTDNFCYMSTLNKNALRYGHIDCVHACLRLPRLHLSDNAILTVTGFNLPSMQMLGKLVSRIGKGVRPSNILL